MSSWSGPSTVGMGGNAAVRRASGVPGTGTSGVVGATGVVVAQPVVTSNASTANSGFMLDMEQVSAGHATVAPHERTRANAAFMKGPPVLYVNQPARQS